MSQPQQRRRARAVLAALAALGLGAWAQPASAQDLIVNEGDPPVELGGGYGYDHVFIDGSTVRFVGDTNISARSIYIGPNVNIAECATPGSDTGCVDARNISLVASERIVIVPALQLQGGGTSAGGSLSISAKSVATGNITTSGQGQRPSGSITLTSSGTVQTGVLQALGAPIVLRGDAGVAVGGGVDTRGTGQIANPPFSAQVGGAFTAVSSAGDIFVGGDVATSGNNTGAAGITGGRGGAVTLDGGDVRLGAIDSSGGTAALGAGGGMGGAAGPVVLNARGSMIALGNIDVSASTGSLPSAGGSVAIKAAAQAATRDINASGANGASPGGPIAITAGAISVGQLASIGGNATATPGNGAGGGSIALTSAGNVASGPIVAYGGNTAGAGFGGGGGSVSVSGVNLTVASVMAYAGTSGITGALGGPVSLLASNNLTIPGAINASGANASTTLPVGAAGGRGGAVTLRAANGALYLGGTVRTVGGAGAPGSGAAKGGPGGNGGAIVVVARRIGELGGLIALGGDAGEAFDEDQAGPGGTGGAITYFGQQPIIGDGLLLVNSDGGDGNPAGAKGFQSQDVAPTGLVIDEATGALTFTGGSPDGDGFTILSTVEKDPTTSIRTAATAGIVPPAPPMCRAVTYQVVATNVALGWVSDPSNAVTWTRPPSAKQACDAAPIVKSGKKTLVKKSKFLKKGKLRLSLSSSGVGSVVVDLMQGSKVLTTATKDIKKAGGIAVDLKLPKAARKPGRYKIRITAKAPTGKKIARSSFILEVTE